MKKSICLKIIIPVLFLLMQFSTTEAQVGINQTNPDASAILDLKSNDRGLLMPRLTVIQIQSITDPSPGLLVYCTDLSIFCFFDGSNWISLPAWGQKLKLGDLTEGVQHLSANTNINSNVGIGTNTPASKLTVTENISIGDNAPAPAKGAYINGKVKIGAPPNAGDTEKLEVDGNINAEGSITATNNINTTGKIQENGNDLLPKGAIIMWSGDPNNIPNGWALCDNVDGRPDLRGRFIVGYENRASIPPHSDNNYKGIKNEGGEKTHVLTTAEMPTHIHSVNAEITDKYTTFTNGDLRNDGTTEAGDNRTFGTSAQRAINVNTGAKGGGASHENRPPYYVLAFIIKL